MDKHCFHSLQLSQGVPPHLCGLTPVKVLHSNWKQEGRGTTMVRAGSSLTVHCSCWLYSQINTTIIEGGVCYFHGVQCGK